MISVIMPTLQKNKKVLNNLLATLADDNSVGEIIVIDNSLKGLDYDNPKLKIITPEENLFVNPSWNVGVKEAKYDIIALFNDDIAIPKDFCSNVVEQMDPSMGIVGVNSADYMLILDDIYKNPQNTNPILEKVNYMDNYFGVAMFLYKENFCPVPEEIKIVYGDVWLVYQTRKSGKPSYRISNQVVYHIGSLSSSEKKFNPICVHDAKIYKRLTVKWYNRLLSYDECWNCHKIRILGITLTFRKFNAKKYINDR